MKILIKVQIFFIISLLLIACGNNEHKRNISTHQAKKTLKEVNKYLTQDDEDVMVGYSRRMGWNMKIDSTGMLYQIYENGTGDKAKKLKFITLNYTVSLLDGTICYSSDSSGVLNFRILQGGKESGLEYGVLKLREGDKARFIMPPYLAHGLIGDENKIPPRSIIVYDVEVLKVADY